MNRIILIIISFLICGIVYPQNKIQFRSIDKAECVKSDNSSLKASFSFSELEAQDVVSERGTFSWLSLPNTVIGGNEGDPQIPVVNELIAVPFGAKPRVEVTSFSTTDYRLADYGIHTLVPRQPSLRKDKRPEDVPFVYNEAAYQTRGLRSEPRAIVSVEGVMRGVQLGKMTIEPVSYDPVSNTLRVFNDIEVEVHFDGADAKATEDMLVKTYSPYFDIVYKQLFNDRAVLDAYSAHPDLYTTPVKMLVVTTTKYSTSTAFQNWLKWKKQKGIYVDVQTVTSSTSASNIRSMIQTKYNSDHPTFLVIIGDKADVTNYTTWSDSELNYSPYVSDNAYASVDNDVYHDLFMSRMSVSSTTELNNLVNKILMYEKYTMPDPSYLNNVTLIAGWDSYGWTAKVGKPTIQYANNYYFNAAHGFSNIHVYLTTGTGQNSECYTWFNNGGVGFLNYTAHGDITMLADPSFTNSNVSSLTNTNKYFWLMGNCCLTANWGNSSTCLGETLIRAANKGAFGYIGSIPESYWYEDYYFGVGATTTFNQMPTQSQTRKGVYDAMFDDTGFNTLNSVPYIGNVAVTYAHAGSYQSSVTDEYYWRAYQCLGDGSVMPYHVAPAANTVSHADILPMGATSFTVSADARSYVAITVNDEIIGVAQVPSSGTVDVPITAPTAAGTAMIVVTRNQRQPYTATVEITGEQYTINATASPEEGGTVTGAGEYYKGTVCTLTAIANHGYEFISWKEGNTIVSEEKTYSFTVTGDASYTAEFTALTPHQVSSETVEHGTVSVSPTTAYKGDIVTLSVTPEPGYCFSEWRVTTDNKEIIPVENNQFVMPDSNVTVDVVILPGHNVTVAASEHGTASVDLVCALEGATVTVTTTPETGYAVQALIVYKTGDAGTIIPVAGRQFTMPAFDVTVVALFNVPQGEDVTIGSGTSTQNGNVLPTYAYYNYSLSEQIYTAAELGGAGKIAAIAFKNSANASERTVDIYLKHTAKESFSDNSDWEVVTTADKVFSGTVSFPASGWFTIQLDTPFSYDGVSNILLCFDDNSNTAVASASAAPKCYTYSTGSTRRALRINNDDINFDPTNSASLSSYSGSRVTYNNQIQLTMAAPSNTAAISLSAETLSGFSYIKGEGPSESQILNMIAAGSEAFVITAPEHYEVGQTPDGPYSDLLTLSAEHTITTNLYIRLKAGLNEGTYLDEILTIQSGETSVEVSLNGEVIRNCYYTYDETLYSDNMTVMCVVAIEGVEQHSDLWEVGAFCGETCRGTAMPLYCPPVDRYILPLIVYGTAGDQIHFKLYDHALNAESTLTAFIALPFDGDGYGSISDPVVLNFLSEAPSTITQTTEMASGWVWWSSNIELGGAQGWALLREAFGSSVGQIKSTTHSSTYQNGQWIGNIDINNDKTYLISVNESFVFELTGAPANPSDHPITIKSGWNWIGYPCQQAMSLKTAFHNFNPSENDVIKSQNQYSTYKDGQWKGSIQTLEPGKGYFYMSYSNENKILIFP